MVCFGRCSWNRREGGIPFQVCIVESSVPWSDFNLPKVCSKILLDSSTLQSAVLISCTELYVAYSKLCRGKLFNRKRKRQTMSEKRHKINKFANYQNIIVRKQSRLRPPCFCFFSRPILVPRATRFPTMWPRNDGPWGREWGLASGFVYWSCALRENL